jgi:hypothetical protein
MQYRWLVGLVTMTVLAVVLAFALPAHPGSAGSLDQEAEHEQTVKIGVTSCGVERWSIKTGTDAGARSINQKALVPANVFHLRTLPAPFSPPVTRRVRPVETTVYSVSAILLRYKYETDSDIHLVIADKGGRTMIAEMPAPQCVGSSSPFLPSIRYVRSKFTSQFHPSSSWHRVNTPIQIAGVGFFDFKHGQSGVAPNAIELHPVLRFSTGTGSAAPPPAPPVSKPQPTATFTATMTPLPNSTATATWTPTATARNTPIPTETATTIPATATSTTSSQSVSVSASVSNASPTRNSTETVYGQITVNGQGVSGVQMNTAWHYKTTTSGCSGITDSTGTASCSRDISSATAGYTVAVSVSFAYNGLTYSTQTSFTPH